MHTPTLLTSLMSISSFILQALAAAPTAPRLEYAFTAKLALGQPIGPITVANKISAVEPITSGTIVGPHFNANVSAGAATLNVLANKHIEIASPSVEVWGTTDDGVDFFVQGDGVGVTGKQFARVSVTIGGKYAYLCDEFILASFTDNKAVTESTIEAWFVKRD